MQYKMVFFKSVILDKYLDLGFNYRINTRLLYTNVINTFLFKEIVIKGSIGKYFFAVFLSILMLVFVSCEKQEKPVKETKTIEAEQTVQEKAEKPTKPLEIPKELQAMITFLSGDVYVSAGGDWKNAVIGDFLKKDEMVKVDKESYCEIQFGNTASVRIQANTEVKLIDIFLQTVKNSVKVGLIKGAVLCKVKKLSKNDSFKVQTPTAVCGVRGTQFGVRLSREKGTVVAVKKGKVAVLPATVDVDAIKEKVKGVNETLLKTIEKIEEAAPVVEANEELTVKKKALKKTEAVYRAVSKEVDKIVASKEEITPEKIAAVDKLVAETAQQIDKNLASPQKISEKSLEKLKPVEKIRIMEIPVPQAAAKKAVAVEKGTKQTSAVKEEAQVLSFEKIGIAVEPKDANIILNGDFSGKGSFSGLFLPGDKLEFVIEKSGYIEKKLEIKVSRGSGRNYQFKLKEKKETIRVNVIPSDAEIIVNGKKEAEGSYSGEFKWGTKLNISARRDGYVGKDITVAVSKGSGKTYNLELREKKETIRVNVIPSDAEIIVNGKKEAEGSYSGEFKWGTKLNISVRRDGYVGKDITVAVSKGSGKTYNLELKKEKERIGIKTSPADAEIMVNGNIVGHGNYSAEYATGETVSIQVQRNEYLSKNLDITVEKGGSREYRVILKPKAVPYRYSVSNNRIIGKLGSYRNVIVSADKKGFLSAVNRRGVKIWGIATKNKPNENSFPEIIGNRLFFSGSSEFIIADVLSGRIIHRELLTGANSHMFGRHSVSYKQNALFPTNKAVKIIEPASGKTVKSINVPGGSKMTPAVYKDTILTVNQHGIFFRINPDNSRIIKEIKTMAIQPVAVTITIHADRAYFPGRRGTVVCINLTQNRVLWQKKPAGVKSIGVFQDLEYGKNTVFMFAKSTIYSFAAPTGNEVFPPIHGISSPPLYYNGYLYAGTMGGELIVIDERTGKIVKSLKLGGIVTTKPVSTQGKIIVGTNNGKIIVINPGGIK